MSKLTSVFHRLSTRKNNLEVAVISSDNDKTRNEKGFIASDGPGDSDEPEADALLRPGELSFEQATAGGLGRHLGIVSTTFLM
jgi:hypothetical protein